MATQSLLKKRIIPSLSDYFSSAYLKLGLEQEGLICLSFHAVVEKKNKQTTDHLLPSLGLSILQYRRIFEHFLEAEYEFISSNAIHQGLSRGKKYIHLSFDDGYYNNVSILPLLNEYKIPIEIFITTSNVVYNKKYWWDVIYDFMRRRGKNINEISREIEQLKCRDHNTIRRHIVENYGNKAFDPISDMDRPLTAGELKTLSEHELIKIGNHTRHHVIMDRVSQSVAEEEIVGAQRDLSRILGYEPPTFAFPNGNCDEKSIKLLEDLGFTIGFSSESRRNRVPNDLEGERRLRIGRYCFFSSLDVAMQCRMVRSGRVAPIFWLKKIQHRMKK